MPSPEPRDRSEILHRILEQEVRRGYDDGTVIGGLEQFLANWQAESAPESAKDSQSLIAVSGKCWRTITRSNRRTGATRVQSALQILNGQTVPNPTGPGNPPPKESSTSPAKDSGSSPRPRKQVASRPQADLDSPLAIVPMLKAEDAKRLEKLGLSTLGDLIQHFPHRHIDRSRIKTIADLKPGEEATIVVNVMQVENRRVTQGRMVITEAALADSTGYIKAVWFNQPYLQRSLTNKRRVVVAGKVEISRNGLELRSPEYEFAESPEKVCTWDAWCRSIP